MNRWKGNKFIYGGLLLIAAALILAGIQLKEAQNASDYAARVLEQMNVQMAEQQDRSYSSRYLPETAVSSMEIDGNEYIGILSIPALDLFLPVMGEWSDSKLKLSPCCYMGSVYADDMIIAAHNYPQHFGGLKKLQIGDQVSFLDTDGNEFQYEVSGLEKLGEDDLEEMKAGTWDLTLFTCSVSGADRITVRCERIP